MVTWMRLTIPTLSALAVMTGDDDDDGGGGTSN